MESNKDEISVIIISSTSTSEGGNTPSKGSSEYIENTLSNSNNNSLECINHNHNKKHVQL